MNAFLFFLTIFFCTLLVLLVPALCLYLIPVRFIISLVQQAGLGERSITAYWGLMGIRIADAAGDHMIEVMVLDRVLYSHAGRADHRAGEKAEPRQSADPFPSEGIFHHIRRLTRPIWRFGEVLYRQSSFEDARGRLHIGLGDPVATGMLYGGYWSSRFVLQASRIFITVEPVFDQKILEMDLVIRLKIDHPLLVMVAVLQLLKHPDVWQTVTFAGRGNRGAVVS